MSVDLTELNRRIDDLARREAAHAARIQQLSEDGATASADDRAVAIVEAAQREYERGVAALQRSDRRGPIYSAIEMTQRELALRTARDDTVNPVRDRSYAASQAAQEQLALLDARVDDDADGLTAEELVQLDTHLRLGAQLLRMSAEQLAARVDVLIAGDNRPRIRANFRALVDELARMDAAVPVNLTGSDVPPGHTERREMLAQAARRLEPKRADLGIARERARQLKRLDKEKALRDRVNAVMHDSEQADLQARLVASGNYTL